MLHPKNVLLASVVHGISCFKKKLTPEVALEISKLQNSEYEMQGAFISNLSPLRRLRCR
jgi:hypothetical protein